MRLLCPRHALCCSDIMITVQTFPVALERRRRKSTLGRTGSDGDMLLWWFFLPRTKLPGSSRQEAGGKKRKRRGKISKKIRRNRCAGVVAQTLKVFIFPWTTEHKNNCDFESGAINPDSGNIAPWLHAAPGKSLSGCACLPRSFFLSCPARRASPECSSPPWGSISATIKYNRLTWLLSQVLFLLPAIFRHVLQIATFLSAGTFVLIYFVVILSVISRRPGWHVVTWELFPKIERGKTYIPTSGISSFLTSSLQLSNMPIFLPHNGYNDGRE